MAVLCQLWDKDSPSALGTPRKGNLGSRGKASRRKSRSGPGASQEGGEALSGRRSHLGTAQRHERTDREVQVILSVACVERGGWRDQRVRGSSCGREREGWENGGEV